MLAIVLIIHYKLNTLYIEYDNIISERLFSQIEYTRTHCDLEKEHAYCLFPILIWQQY